MAQITPTILFAMPAYGDINPKVMMNLMNAYAYTLSQGANVAIETVSVPRVDYARNHLIEAAINNYKDVTHVMWVDSDMLIPRETVPHLLKYNVRFVSALYHYKYPPHLPVARDGNGEQFTILEMNKVHSIGYTGLGCALVELRTYRSMERVYQDRLWHNLTPGAGEDTWFCDRLHAMDIPVHLDTTVQCGHLTTTAITTKDWEQ